MKKRRNKKEIALHNKALVDTLNKDFHISYKRIAIMVDISKPQLGKYYNDKLSGTEQAKITFKLNQLLKQYLKK